MLTFADACRLIDQLAIAPRTVREPLERCLGRSAAEEVRLERDQPPFDRATMDGYAVALDGASARFRVVGTVAAGNAFSSTIAPGTAVRIMTGAPVPAGTTVVPLEATDRGAESVTVSDPKALAAGRNTARRGEDGKAGDVVVAKGTVLSPLAIAAAAMAGAESIAVTAPPRLAIITTGDEVGGSGAAAIRDSNGPFLAAFAATLGLPWERHHVRDDADALRSAIAGALERNEVVVTTGGVSAGDKDLVPPTAAALGLETVLHQVAMQPGKPVFLAQGGGRHLVGLPGNPVSVVATAHLILLRLLGRFGIPVPAWRRTLLAVPWEHRGQRQLFLPARLGDGRVEPVKWNGSGDLLAAASADGLVDLAPGAWLKAGDAGQFLPYVGGGTDRRTVLPPRR